MIFLTVAKTISSSSGIEASKITRKQADRGFPPPVGRGFFASSASRF